VYWVRWLPDARGELFRPLQLARRRPVRRPRGPVQTELAAALLQVEQHHGLPADARSRRFHHAEGEGGRDCRVHRVAPRLQHLHAGLGGVVVLGGDHPLGRDANPLRIDHSAVAGIQKVLGQRLSCLSDGH